MPSHGSYNLREFALEAEKEVKRLEAQVDLFWDREAEYYESLGFADMEFAADIGCANGYYLSLLKKHFPNLSVHGVEVEPQLAAAARKRIEDEGLAGCEARESSAYETGLESGRYDAVVMRGVLEHLEDTGKALAELWRILKPGGQVVIIDNDFAFHERTVPEIPELDDLYEAYCRARVAEGGNPTIGRELPIHLAEAGFSVSPLTIVCAHSAQTGDEVFLRAEGSGIPLKLVEQGFLDRDVLDELVLKWGAMMRQKNHAIYRQIFVAQGQKLDRPPGSEEAGGEAATEAPAEKGEADRKAPPAEDVRRALEESYVAPRTPMEQTIADVWQEVFQLEKVGINESFFDLGGDSLLMVEVRTRLRKNLDKNVPVVELFQHPTIAALAEHLSPKTSSEGSGKSRLEKIRESAKRQARALGKPAARPTPPQQEKEEDDK